MALDVAVKLRAEGAQEASADVERVTKSLDRLSSAFGTVGHYGLGVFAVLPALQGMARQSVEAADAVITMRNRLELATGSTAAAARAFDRLYAVAQQSRTSFTELGGVYATMARAGIHSVAVVQAIGNAMAIGGGSAESMKAALVQLGQGMSAGVLRGEELNSVMEQAPRLAQALADGLGVPIGALRKLGEQGELTSKKVVEALMKSAPQLAEEMAKSQSTVGQAMTVLGNASTKLVGDIDQATGASKILSASLRLVADGADLVGEVSRKHEAGVAALATALGVGVLAASALAAKAALASLVPVIVGVGTALGPVTIAAVAVAAAVSGLVAAMLKLGPTADQMESRLSRLRGMASTPEREEQVRALQRELAIKRAEDMKLDTGAEDARFQRSKQAYDERQDAMKRIAEIQRQLSGEDEKYAKITLELGQALRDKVITQEQFNKLAAQAWQDTKAGREAAGEAKKQAAADAKILEDAAAAMRKILGEETEATNAWLQAEDDRRAKQIKAAEDALAAAEWEFQTHGMLKSQIAEVTLQRLRDRQAAFVTGSENAKAVQREIDAQVKLIDVLRRGEQRDEAEKAAKEATAEWKRASDVIEQSLTDSLMRGFEGGKGAAQSFVDGLKNLFKALVLRPVIQPIAQAGASTVLGAFGMGASGGASAATGGGATGSILSAAGSIFGGGSFGLGAQGTMAAIGESGIFGALGSVGTSAASLFGSGSMSGVMGGLGAIAPYALPLLAVGALAASMRKKKTPAAASYGGASLLDGVASTTDPRYRFVGDARGLTGLDQGTAGSLQGMLATISGLAGALGGSAGNLSAYSQSSYSPDSGRGVAGLDITDASGRAIYQRVIDGTTGGADGVAAALQTLVTEGLVAGVRSAKLPKRMADYIDQALPVNASQEQLQAVVATAGAARQLWTVVEQMGGAFSQVAGLSVQATEELANLTGGFDALTSKSKSFVENYFSRDEQAGLKAAEIRQVLDQAGVGADFATRDQFRAAFDGLDVSSSSGRSQMAALLNVADSFAGLTDYLAETGQTLNDAAGQAPATPLLNAMLGGQTTQTEQLVAIVDRLGAVESAVNRVADAVAAAGQATADAVADQTINVSWRPGELGIAGGGN